MSDENLWGDSEPFNDMPDEAQLDENGRPKVSPPVQLQRPKTIYQPTKVEQHASLPVPEQSTTEWAEGMQGESLDEEESSEEAEALEEVLTDANLRLEQGTLYKMFMTHNHFEGVDADPRAIQNVKKEIVKFAQERMEIMLGMRKETAVVEHLEIEFPFNALEVNILKQLAYAATNGASENSDRYVPEVTRTTEEVPTIGKKPTLNPISRTSPKKAPRQEPQKATLQKRNPLPNRAAAPVKRTKLDQTIDQIAREEGIPRELLEEDIVGIGGKPIHEMSENEILERNKIAAKRRNTQVRSSKALPMPSIEQQQMMAVERATQVAGSTPLMAQILDAVKKMPIKHG